MVAIKLLTALILASALQVECGDVPERTCGILFSSENFGGESFSFNDFDQSADLKREYRPSREGWTDTKSIQVENGCAITTCSDPYFLGTCKTFTSKEATQSQLLPTIQSVNCSCERSCRCEDFYITNDEKELSGEIGRAYLKGGCDKCNSHYKTLYKQGTNFFIEEQRSVEALVFHKDCSIRLFSEDNFGGDVFRYIDGPVYRGRIFGAKSYHVTCRSTQPVDRSSIFKDYLPLGYLPVNPKARQENHPGVQAAIESERANRSSRHAYIIIIGLPDAIPGIDFGIRHCLYEPNEQISECRIPVAVHDLRVTTELRIIIVPMLWSDYSVKALDKYLSTHEELSRNIPNAVIVCNHMHDKDIFDESGEFQSMLNAIKTFRHRLIDDNYSNLIFLLRGLHGLIPRTLRRQPGTKVAEFEEIIRGKLDFLNPLAITIASGTRSLAEFHLVNGYAQIENGEFWPRNLEISLANICEKSGDSLGKSVLRAYFQYTLPPRSNTRPVRIVEDRLSADGSSGSSAGSGPSNGNSNDESSVDEAVHDGTNDGQDIHYGTNDGQGIFDYPDHTEADYTLLDTLDQDCGCVAVSTELKEKIDQLKSEIAVERTERLVDADRIEADIWEKIKLKWRTHFEL